MTTLIGLLNRWQIAAAALVLGAIVHICTTLVMPAFYRSDAYSRLIRNNLPLDQFVFLPQAQPRAQILPFQMPDMRYAICRFDLTQGPVSVKAVVPEPGWTVTLYSAEGESYYTYPGVERRTTLNLMVLPPGDLFLGSLTEARNHDQDLSMITAPGRRGIAVVRAPLKGRTFAAQTERDLAQATCRHQQF